MSLRSLIAVSAGVIVFSLSDDIQINPADISDFDTLYKQNCAGCHGTDGKGGAAIALADPVYLAIADDAVLQQAATNGISGTAMPAFAESAGGMLTDKQIAILVNGIRVLLVLPRRGRPRRSKSEFDRERLFPGSAHGSRTSDAGHHRPSGTWRSRLAEQYSRQADVFTGNF